MVSGSDVGDGKMDINEKCRQLPVLTARKVEWGGGKLHDGTQQWPFPKYDEDVTCWIDTMYDLELMDHDYLQNIKNIEDKPIEELTRDEVLTRMTWLIRGERFCDGLIAEWLENGSLESLCTRLQNLTKVTD